MPFKKGNSGNPKGAKPGKKRKTILKESLGIKSFDDLKEKILINFDVLMSDKNKQIKALMTKEAAKYTYPQKKELEVKPIDINVNITSTID